MSRHLDEFGVIADLERLAAERPDLSEDRRRDLYEQASREGEQSPQYSMSGLFAGISPSGRAVHAFGLKVPLFDVPEFETILARIAELEPAPSPMAGRPSGRDWPLLDRLAEAYNRETARNTPLRPTQEQVAKAADYLGRSGMTTAMGRHKPPISWAAVIARAHKLRDGRRLD